MPTERSEGFAHEFFVAERAVDLSSIEECYAAFDRCPDDRDHLLLVPGGTVATAHAHAAESDCRNFEVAFSKFALLHCFSFETSWPRQAHWCCYVYGNPQASCDAFCVKQRLDSAPIATRLETFPPICEMHG